MRVPTSLSRGGLGFNMTPMIDVVFLLIIFFLVATRLADQNRQRVDEDTQQVELDLSKAGTGQPLEDGPMRRLVINVLGRQQPEGRIIVGGNPIAVEELGPLIRARKRWTEHPLEVRIRSDRTVPYRVVEPIMVACAQAGVWRVTFAVLEK